MRHGSLFSGIGGFDLAAEWMGWDNVFHCEWMPFPRKVLSHYWPEAISYHDITATDFRQHAGQIDILTGGFPCQPYSAAGKRKGKDDDRHLWPHMLRCIREVKPRWVVGENVFGLATWNGGLVFEEVCAELEAEGYAVQPFVLPAAAVNAPHRRDRVWFVAYTNDSRTNIGMPSERKWQESDGIGGFTQSEPRQNCRHGDAADATDCGCGRGNCKRCSNRRQRIFQDERTGGKMGSEIERCCGKWDAADAESAGSQRQCEHRQRQVQPNGRNSRTIPANWQDFPTQSPICGGDDGLPTQLDGITFPKWRAESIKGYGNAIVPQVALQIFKAIQQYEAL